MEAIKAFKKRSYSAESITAILNAKGANTTAAVVFAAILEADFDTTTLTDAEIAKLLEPSYGIKAYSVKSITAILNAKGYNTTAAVVEAAIVKADFDDATTDDEIVKFLSVIYDKAAEAK